MPFHSVKIDHPSGHDVAHAKLIGAPDPESTVTLVVDRGLKTGKLDHIPLTEDDLVQLIAQAADKLRILRGLSR
jgi:hypothetical protein